jgi:hypothetical protein
MKIAMQKIKKYFSFSLFPVAVLLFIYQFYQIYTEVSLEVISTENMHSIPLFQKENTKADVNCESFLDFGHFISIISKCSIAFFFGGMISNRKFLKIGIF